MNESNLLPKTSHIENTDPPPLINSYHDTGLEKSHSLKVSTGLVRSDSSDSLRGKDLREDREESDIVYNCSKCIFNTLSLTDIKSHISTTCPLKDINISPDSNINPLNIIENYKQEISKLETTIKFHTKKIKKLEKDSKKKDIELSNLSTYLSIEKMKTNILKFIIEKETDIDISSIIEEKNNEIHIYETRKDLLPIYLHKDIEIIEEEVIIVKPDPSKFKKIKNKKSKKNKVNENSSPLLEKIDYEESVTEISIQDDSVNILKLIEEVSGGDSPIVPEMSNELIQEETLPNESYLKNSPIIKSIKEYNEDDISYDFLLKNQSDDIDFSNVNKSNYKKLYNKLIQKLRNERCYRQTLQNLQYLRKSSLEWLDIQQYHENIDNDIKKLEILFKKKNFEIGKYKKIISESLSPMESRITKYQDYFKTYLTVEDMELMKKCFKAQIKFENKYIPFTSSIFKYLKNYNIVLFTIKESLEHILLNTHGFNNIVYIDIPSSKKSDPHSFYILKDIHTETNENLWRMDCRFEDISKDISTQLLPYAIDLYKKIYKDIFGDNNFREDLEDHCGVTGSELEQLAENIFNLHDLKKLRNILKDIILEKAILNPTEKDKINFKKDDKYQKSRFQKLEDKYNPQEIPKILFPNISDIDIAKFIKKIFN